MGLVHHRLPLPVIAYGDIGKTVFVLYTETGQKNSWVLPLRCDLFLERSGHGDGTVSQDTDDSNMEILMQEPSLSLAACKALS